MGYYHRLGLVREPFASAPDPAMLYRSPQHLECLERMEIAIRLRRGLNVVIGAVGTGKTTLARELRRFLSQDAEVLVYRLDDPAFPDVEALLVALARLFGLEVAGLERDRTGLKTRIKAFLLARGAEGRIVALLVDEGQTMPGACLEMLRELLNIETDTQKLLQIVMFAQPEFDALLAARPNLADRVHVRYVLGPLDRRQTRRLIETRLDLCAANGRAPRFFTAAALGRLYRVTGGYPRKIVGLCNMALLLAVGHGWSRVTWRGVGRASREQHGPAAGRPLARRLAVATAFVGLLALSSMLAVIGLGRAPWSREGRPAPQAAVVAANRQVGTPPAPAGPRATAGQVVAEAAPAQPPGQPLAPPSVLSRPDATPASAPAPDKTSAVSAGPTILGRVATRSGWLASRQVWWVYGTVRPQTLRRLAEANPHVDVDRLRVGQALTFPALPAPPPPAGTCLLAVGRADSLEQALDIVSQSGASSVPLVLFVTRQPGRELRFDVVVPRRYATPEAARAALAALPASLADQGRILAHFPQGTRYFTSVAAFREAGQPATQPARASAVRPQVAAREPR